MNKDGYEKLLRVLGVVFGAGLISFSIWSSYAYFGIKSPRYGWIGALFAGGITYLELAWRKKGMQGNKTIAVLGIIVYVYDILTNAMGLLIALFAKVTLEDYSSDPILFVICLLLGFAVAVAAEPILTYGITGQAQSDLLGEIVDMFNGSNKVEENLNKNSNNGSKNNQQNNRNNNNQHNNNNNNNQKRHEDRHMNDDMEDDGFTPLDDLDRPMGREARQNMGQKHQHQPEPSYHTINGGNLNKKDRRNMRG